MHKELRSEYFRDGYTLRASEFAEGTVVLSGSDTMGTVNVSLVLSAAEAKAIGTWLLASEAKPKSTAAA